MTQPFKSTLLALLAITGSMTVQAASAPAATPEEHESHHAQSAPAAASVPAKDANLQMQRMREMHDKMMAAKTPEERRALMTEYHQVMRDGMAMMKKMHRKTAAPGKTAGMMSAHGDMMSMMMTMMEDGGCMGNMGQMSPTPRQKE